MRGLRHLGLGSIVVLLLCLPAKGEPASQVYSVHVPAASRVEASVSHTADWEVSITFDAETCEVFCEYRRKDGGLHLFLAPVTELRVYTDRASSPRLVIVDPAGTREPGALSSASLHFELFCVVGQSPMIGDLPEVTERPSASARAVQSTSALPFPIGLPLRI